MVAKIVFVIVVVRQSSIAPPNSSVSASLAAASDAASALTNHLTFDLLPSIHCAASNLSQWTLSNRSSSLLREKAVLEADINVQVNKNASILGE